MSEDLKKNFAENSSSSDCHLYQIEDGAPVVASKVSPEVQVSAVADDVSAVDKEVYAVTEAVSAGAEEVPVVAPEVLPVPVVADEVPTVVANVETPAVNEKVSPVADDVAAVKKEVVAIVEGASAVENEDPAINDEVTAVSAVANEVLAIAEGASAVANEEPTTNDEVTAVSAVAIEVVAIVEGAPAVPNEGTVANDEVTAVTEEVSAVANEVLAIAEGASAVAPEVSIAADEAFAASCDEFSAVADDIFTTAKKVSIVEAEVPAVADRASIAADENSVIADEVSALADFCDSTQQLAEVEGSEASDEETETKKRHYKRVFGQVRSKFKPRHKEIEMTSFSGIDPEENLIPPEKLEDLPIWWDELFARGRAIWGTIVFTSISIFFYLYDIVTDINLTVEYYYGGQYTYFGLTLAFILLPGVVIWVCSLKWYWQDWRTSRTQVSWIVPHRGWIIISMVFCFLQMSNLPRYVEVIMTAVQLRKCRKENTYHELRFHAQKMVTRQVYVGHLSLLEVFLESVPQLILQLYIVTSANQTTLSQTASIIGSLISFAWGITSFYKNLQDRKYIIARIDDSIITLHNTECVKCPCYWWLTVFLSAQFFSIIARVLALTLFASSYMGWSIWLVVTCHFFFMVILKASLDPDNVKSGLRSWTNWLSAAILVVVHFEWNGQWYRNRKFYLYYCAFCFFENLVLMTCWFLTIDNRLVAPLFYPSALVVHFISTIMGFTLLELFTKRWPPITLVAS